MFENWPGFASGGSGVLNTMTPGHCNTNGIVDLADCGRSLHLEHPAAFLEALLARMAR
ncbi:hypothetical protein [Cryobacterium ruanii]|uniref:hypothetical protein n=1 Tax=Cryobacterium ruanii TaxID=1259197 RepID=UPI00141BF205|nr:hypothetical protein [Cryobacterium ruanii]